MAYRMAPVLVTLNDLEGHCRVAGFFKCNPSNISAVFYQISTDSALARSLSDSWAIVFIGEVALGYYGRRIIVTPFVNQQFSLQVVERCRAVQFVEQFTSGEDVSPAGRHSAHRRSNTMHTARPSTFFFIWPSTCFSDPLLYADGHVAHDAPRAVWVTCDCWSVVDT